MSLFEEQDPNSNQDQAGGGDSPSQAPNGVDQLLAGIKNENGEQKYANVEEALKGLSNAQEFISTLKREKAEVSEQLKSQSQLEEMLSKVNQQQDPDPQEPQVTQGLSAEDVLKVVDQREKDRIAEANLSTCLSTIKEKLGAEYKEILKAKTSELGLTTELVDTMAKSSPDSVYKLLGIDVKKAAKAEMAPSTNTQTFSQEAPPAKRFDPFSSKAKPGLEAWRESVKETNARLGIEN